MKVLLAFLFLSCYAVAQTTTTITGTFYARDGVTPFSGTVRIQNNAFQTARGQNVPARIKPVAISAGTFSIALEPTDSATPGTPSYTLTFQEAQGSTSPPPGNRTWWVPISSSPVTESIVRLQPVGGRLLTTVLQPYGASGGAPGAGVPAGGTSGQKLTKNSNTDYDTHWVDDTGGVGASLTSYGCVGDGVTDDSACVQSAVNSSNTRIYAPVGQYRLNTAINLTNRGATALGGTKPLELYGDGGTRYGHDTTNGNAAGGTVFVCNTGSACFDLTGSQHITLRNFSICASTDCSNGSLTAPGKVGVLVARSSGSHFAQMNELQAVSIYMPNATSATTFGTLGVYDVAAEHLRLIGCDIVADTPMIIAGTDVASFASPFQGALYASTMNVVKIISSNFSAWYSAGLDIYSADTVDCDGCYFSKIGGSAYAPVRITGTTAQIRITGGQIENYGGALQLGITTVQSLVFTPTIVEPSTSGLIEIGGTATFDQPEISISTRLASGTIPLFLNFSTLAITGGHITLNSDADTLSRKQQINDAVTTLAGTIIHSTGGASDTVVVAGGSKYTLFTPTTAGSVVQGIADPSDTQVINYIGPDGVQHRISQSGSGATSISALTDFAVSATSTTVTVGCASTACRVRIGEKVYTFTGSATASSITGNAASTTVYPYIEGASGALKFGVDGTKITGASFTGGMTIATGVTNVPPNSLPLGSCEWSGSAFTGCTDMRALLSRMVLDPGSGIAITQNPVTGRTLIELNGSTVGFLDAANTWSNTNDFAVSPTLDIPGTSLTAGSVYYQGASALALARANSASTLPAVCLAISAATCAYSGSYTFGSSQSWTKGNIIYVSADSAGALVTSAPSTAGQCIQRVGVALDVGTILIMPSIDVGCL